MPNGETKIIESAFFVCLQEYGIGIENVAAFGSGGTNVMVGCRSGVGTELKKNNV